MEVFLLKLVTGLIVFSAVIVLLPAWALPSEIATAMNLFGSGLSYFDFMLPMGTIFTILSWIILIEGVFMTLKIWFMIKSWFIMD